MKKAIAVLLITVIVCFSSCGKGSGDIKETANPTQSENTEKPVETKIQNTEVIQTSAMETENPAIEERNEDLKNYHKIGAKLTDETMNNMFGGCNYPKNVVSVLGEPEKIIKKYGSFDRWYFKQGVEIDVIGVNDIPMLTNYIYINPTSDIKTDRGIGIGSSRDEVLKAYEYEINPEDTNDEMIVAGSKSIGIFFIMKDDKVNSIYIVAGMYTVEYFGEFEPRE